MSNKNRVHDSDSPSDSLTKQMESLKLVENNDDLFNIAYAIAPDEVCSSWNREQILEIVEDILMSRL